MLKKLLRKPFLARQNITYFAGLISALTSFAIAISFNNEAYGKLVITAIALPVVLLFILDQLRIRYLQKALRKSPINDSLSKLKIDLESTMLGNVRISLMVPSGEDSFKLAWRISDEEKEKLPKFARYYSISRNTDIYSVSKTLKPFFIGDISGETKSHKYINSRMDWKPLYNSIVCVPLKEEQKLFGILCIDSTQNMDEKIFNSILERIAKIEELNDFTKIASLYEN